MSLNVSDNHVSHTSIFRAYDIRGIVDQTFFVHDAYLIGRAFVTEIAKRLHKLKPIICVGYDGRLSSPAIKEALIEGIMASGGQVIEIGRGPTPMTYVAVKTLGADAGMMVTGSHNPPSHNGIKMMLAASPFFGDDITLLGQRCEQRAFQQGHGSRTEKNIQEAYIESLLKGWSSGKQSSLKVAWDAGHGATAEMMNELTKQLPGRHFLLNDTIDGTFPAHHPDPSVAENMQQLITLVKEKQCDLGIAFDGDGDRIGVVDHMGRMLEGDQLVSILALEVLHHHPSGTIIMDIKTSQLLLDFINEKGGHSLLWKCGHSLIKAKMIEEQAVLAGEVSGHIFFADHGGFDDGLYAAVRLLSLIERTKTSLYDWYEQLPKALSTPEIRIDVPEEHKFAIIDHIKACLEAEGVSFLGIDGVRVHTDKGWWLLRASNTQAVLVMRCESSTEPDLDRLVKGCEAYIAKAKSFVVGL